MSLSVTRLFRLAACAVAFGAVAVAIPGPTVAGRPRQTIELEVLGTYASGIFEQGASEVVAYDERTERVFAVNAAEATVDVLDVSDPSAPTKVTSIDLAATLMADPDFDGSVGNANSVAVHGGILAVAVEADPKTDTGWAVFYDTDTLGLISWIGVGALPDMLCFTHDGRRVLVANEGEPNSYGEADSVDPEGSVTVIEVKAKAKKLSATTVDFHAYDGLEDDLRAAGVRLFGPGARASQDLEPEYIAATEDGKKAFVTLQENNAVAVLDLKKLEFVDILPLGFKDHSLAGNGLDGSDRDGAGNSGRIQIAPWPVYGMYLPDAIATYRVRGKDYFVTANEGDSRQDWFEEEARLKDLDLDPTVFPDADDLQDDDFIGRLTVTTTLGDADGDGLYEAVYAFGGRSFSIWAADGTLAFDSGDAFEQITAEAYPTNFNSDHAANQFDTRSDNKGPEPEGIVLGRIGSCTYAFIGLERIGGIMVYDISEPTAPEFVQYINHRDFSGDPEAGTAGDLGPEGLAFVPANRSPTGEPMLVVGNEVSGTTTLYAIRVNR